MDYRKYLLTSSVLFILFCFSSCFVIKPVEFYGIDKVRVNKFTGNTLFLNAGLNLKNPNNFGFWLKNADINIFIGEKEIGKVSHKSMISIPANSLQVYTIPLEVPVSGILKETGSIIRMMAKREIPVRFMGQLKIGKFLFSKKIFINETTIISTGDIF